MPPSAGSERRALRRDHGQATVELALCLPLVCLMLLGVVQVAVIVHEQLVVQLAAREGARAAAVSATPRPSGAAAAERSGLDGRRATVTIDAVATSVRVNVAAVVATDLPLIGALLPDVTVTATVTMEREPP